MKLRGRVLKLKSFLAFLLIVLLTAGVIACGDDGDDSDGGGSKWKTISDDEGVIQVDVPKSWKVEEICSRDPNSDELLVCELSASPNIDKFETEWDEDATNGIHIIIARAEAWALVGVTNINDVLTYFNEMYNYDGNCRLNKVQGPITGDDGSIALKAEYVDCGQSDAEAAASAIMTAGGEFLIGFFGKNVSLSENQTDKMNDSIAFDWP